MRVSRYERVDCPGTVNSFGGASHDYDHVAVINHMKNDSTPEESDEHLVAVKGMIKLRTLPLKL